ncbi:hypothetical protein GDO81_028409 [Engystomops pustulosus]|uniref:Uncharacterized protein n=1 Tax=Engystomops pustulosus TaxID=76066 RepID=A0AAV6YHA1_ENGPU|nr:hypothetical protein GDO81_028409 [Engystomops pustulosus]
MQGRGTAACTVTAPGPQPVLRILNQGAPAIPPLAPPSPRSPTATDPCANRQQFTLREDGGISKFCRRIAVCASYRAMSRSRGAARDSFSG